MLELFIFFSILGLISYYGLKHMLKTIIKNQNIVENVTNRVRLKYLLLFLLIGFYLEIHYGNYPLGIKELNEAILPVFIVIFFVYLVIRFFDGLIYELIKEYAQKTTTQLDDMLLPIIKNLVYLTSFAIIIIIILAKLGYDVSAFVAGLGISGLAVAMASQEILQNFFGGVIIIFDKTFKPGDRIKLKGYEGEVKEITLRTTVLKLDDGSLVKIPNSAVLKEAVVNLSER